MLEFRELEPRIAFDAAFATAAIDALADAANPPADMGAAVFDAPESNDFDDLSDIETTAAPADAVPSGPTHIVFVDPSLSDAETLLSSIDPDAEIIVLDPNRDGVTQMAEALDGRSGIESIQILSHGEPGRLQLGNAVLDAGSMSDEHAAALSTIGSALAPDGDILVFGCNFGAGEAGAHAVSVLSAITGADIAASDDATGHADLGGDWNLEVELGAIEARIALDAQSAAEWTHTLDATPIGAETLVNASAAGAQATSLGGGRQVAVDDSGDHVVVWQDAGNIFARKFDADGAAIGGTLNVNTVFGGDTWDPAVAINDTGAFVVVWTGNSADNGIRARLFNPTGAFIGVEIVVNAYGSGNQYAPSVAMNSSGFTVVWTSDGQDGDGTAIVGQRFDLTGAKIGGEFIVNTTTAGLQATPSIAMNASGDTVVVWTSPDGNLDGVFARIYDPSGTAVTGEFQVNTFTTGAQSLPTVGVDDAGNFVVAWTSDGQDGDSTGIVAKRFDAAGVAIGAEFVVNSVIAGLQDGSSVAVAGSGEFVVQWNDANRDGNSWGQYARLYDASGNAVSEVLLNTTTLGSQDLGDIAWGGNRIVSVWSGNGAGDADGVFLQRFSGNSPPSGIEARPGVTANELLADYEFEAANDLGRDDSGDGNDLTLFGAPTLTTGPSGGGALYLTGGDYAELPAMTTGGAMTIAGSVRFDSTGLWQRVFDFGQANSAGIGNIYVGRFGATNDLTFTIETNPGVAYRAIAAGAITDGAWLHFVATVDTDGTMNLYVNGVLADVEAGATPTIGVRDNHYIGYSNWADDLFDGAIDNFFVAEGAVTASEALALYNQTTGFSVAENSANGTVLGTVVGADPDAGGSLAYSLLDDAGGRFAIDSVTGEITVANGAALDFEAAATHTIVVEAQDAGGLTTSRAFTVTLTNANDAPTGLPYIAPVVTEGQAIGVNVTAINDADGLGPFSYEWLRDGVAISGATANFYVPVDADVGTAIAVRISWIDGLGNSESMTSSATAPIINVNDTPTGLPVVTGTATEDQTLGVNTAGIADDDGLGAFSYQWLRNGVAISGATASTYTLGDADVGATISVRVSWVDAHGTAETVTSAATAPVGNVNDAPTGLPVITGTVTEDQTLAAVTSGIADNDGLGAFSYQWLRNGLAIPGATASTYMLGDADVGAAISVRVSYTDGAGTAETLTSAATGPVANVNDAPAGLPVITGTATEDQTLGVNTAGIADADGLGAFSYQWLRNGVAIPGATATAYTLGDADVGQVISVRVGYTDGNGTAETLTSAATAPVANVNDAPVAIDDAFTVDEDSAAIVIDLAANDTDLDSDPLTVASVAGVAITPGVPQTIAVPNGVVDVSAGGLFTFTPDPDYYGPAGFGYTVTDGNGGTDSGAVSIDVLPVDDIVGATLPAAQTIAEDNTLIFSASNGNAIVLTDPDGVSGADVTVRVSVPAGTGTLTLGGVAGLLTVSGNGTGEVAILGSVTDITAALDGLAFVPVADWNGALGISVQITRPSNAGLLNGGFELPDYPDADLANYPLDTSVPGWSTSATDDIIEVWDSGYSGVPSFDGDQFVELNATQVSTLSQTFTPSTASGQLTLTFAHRGRAGVDTMSVTAIDLGANGVAGGGDDVVLFNQSYSTGNTAWAQYQADLGAATGNPIMLAFTSVSAWGGNPVIGNLLDAVNVFGSPLSVTGTIPVTVTPVADIVADAVATSEDTPVIFNVLTGTNGASADSFENPGRQVVSVVQPANGTVGFAADGTLTYTPDPDFHGADSFSYTVESPAGVTETVAVAVNVTPVNDGPSGLPLVVGAVAEDQTITADVSGVSDADGLGALSYQWYRDGVAISGATSASYALGDADVGAAITVEVSYTDADGTAEAVVSAPTAPVGGVNDAPVNSVPGTLSTPVDAALILSSGGGNAISISDIDAGAVQVQLTASNGVLRLNGTAGLTFSAGDGFDDATMTFTGSIADINAALDGLQFTPGPGFNGPAAITVATSDLGNSGTGGALSDTDVVAVQVGAWRFQQGVDGYAGTQDTFVDSFSPNANNGAATFVQVDDLLPEQTGLLRFDNIFGTGPGQIPPGSTINSASLSFYVLTSNLLDAISILDSVTVHQMLGSWSEASSHNSLTNGVQLDNVEASAAALASFDAGSAGWKTVTGLASIVQNWSDGGANNGFAFRSALANLWQFASSEHPSAGLRPYLTIDFTPPQPSVVTPSAVQTFVENGPPVAIDPGLVLTDADSPVMTGATIAIANFVAGEDSLAFTNQSGITGSWDNVTGTLTLSGSSSVANYQAALRSITYANSSDTPDMTARLIEMAVDDAYSPGVPATITLNVTASNDAPVGLPLITGTATEEQTLTADISGISDPDGLGAFAYQWLRNGVAIGGATASTYTLGDADTGAAISVQVSYTDGQGTPETIVSAPTAPVANVNDAPAGLPAIVGVAIEDQTLVADTSAIADNDGLGAFSFQWFRDGVAIAGATASTYTLGDADPGAAITVEVRYTDGWGTLETLVSAPTAPVANVNDAPTGLPVITGVATEDQTLTADVSGIADADGLGAFSYQWFRNGVAIGGANATTYTLGDADVGAVIHVETSYTDAWGTSEGPLASAPTAPIANVNDAPAGLPVITGVVTEDQTLLADVSALSDNDGLGAFSFQWFRDGAPIAGATASAYTLGNADVGTAITVAVSWTDGLATPETVVSAPTVPVANVNDVPSGIPVITGTVTENQTLTADVSGIADDDGLGAFAFQWFRNGVPIAGATAQTYTLGDADVGAAITVAVSYTDGWGTPEGPLVSAQTAAVANVNDVPVGVPVITGIVTEDQTLTADVSAIADNDGLGAFAFQWFRNGVPIAGATAQTYTLGDADVGAAITVAVSWMDGWGTPETVVSAPTIPVVNVNDVPVGVPVITGIVTEDQTLTADVSGIADDDGLGAFAFQWFRNGVAIAGATAQAYTLGDADVGTLISVEVRYTDAQGTAEGPLASAQTAPVANVNDAPAGAPVITGPVVEDQTLVADVSAISDDDGLGAFAYQWYRDTGAGPVAIAGATGSSYSLGDDDVSAAISVAVSWTDGWGTVETVMSAPTGPVVNVNDDPVITSDGGGASVTIEVPENQAVATVITSADVDGGAPLYEIIGGSDAASFAINSASGELRFLATPNYEAPADANGDRIYEVLVRVGDGNGGFDTQQLVIVITDVSGDSGSDGGGGSGGGDPDDGGDKEDREPTGVPGGQLSEEPQFGDPVFGSSKPTASEEPSRGADSGPQAQSEGEAGPSEPLDPFGLPLDEFPEDLRPDDAPVSPPEGPQGDEIVLDLRELDRDALWKSLDEVASDVTEPETFLGLELRELSLGGGVALTAGVVAWALRGGALASSLLVALPALHRFDPILVVVARKRRAEPEPGGSVAESIFDFAPRGAPAGA